MALVLSGYEAYVSLKDNGGNVSTKKFDLTAVTIADAITDTATIIAELIDVTDANIASYRVAAVYKEDAFVHPGEGVQVENQASVSCLIDGAVDKYFNVKIPAPDQDIFVGTSGPAADVVDVTDLDLLAYLALFQTGGVATISDGEVLGAPLSGKRIHRRSSKG
jgi:hypothetical protein